MTKRTYVKWAVPLFGLTMSSVFLPAQQARVASGPRPLDIQVRRTTSVLDAEITIGLTRVPLGDALEEIGKRAGVPVMYGRTTVPVDRKVTVQGTKITVAEAMRQALAGTGTEARLTSEGHLIVAPVTSTASARQAQGTIAGTVFNAKTKTPLSGAAVTVDNETKGVVTRDDGTFRIPASAGAHTVRVRRVGYTRTDVNATVTAEQTTRVDIGMEPSASVLEDVVVTGSIVATERKAIPTPITVITADDIAKRGIVRIDQLFRGEVPGVLAVDLGSSYLSSDGRGGAVQTSLYSRGSASWGGQANPPKVYVDGVELADPGYLGVLDPKSIERIEVVAGPQAASLYGSGAISGVMQIFTKKGNGRSRPDATLNLRYGILQNSMSDGMTPRHDHSLNVTGGTGPSFTYSGTGSYQYDGQWQPGAYLGKAGVQGGISHVGGPFTMSASVSFTRTENGAAYDSPVKSNLVTNGQWATTGGYSGVRHRVSTAVGQTIGFNMDYRASDVWQHHLTVGRSVNDFVVDGGAPSYAYDGDTLFSRSGSLTNRTSSTYNMTFIPSRGVFSSNLVVGANGAWGSGSSYDGYNAWAVDGFNGYGKADVARIVEDENYGGFGQAQLGLWERLFFTGGMRVERSPRYGADHKFDWTPTVGASFVVERGIVTAKFLSSYGRTTRPPLPNQRVQQVDRNSITVPSQWVAVFANDKLTPEYGSGPQGGLEVYVGNVASFTVNRYQQETRDLILPVAVDSFYQFYPDYNFGFWTKQMQYQNVANVLQKGWEGTASLNYGPLSLKGTYSWSDSRVRSLGPGYPSAGTLCVSGDVGGGCRYVTIGAPFNTVPTHSGNVTANYGFRGTSVTLVSNWIGESRQIGATNFLLYDNVFNQRLRMYSTRVKYVDAAFVKSGYIKSDLNVSQRITPWVSATLNVINLGNSVGSEGWVVYPTLGRQTMMGVSMRFPNSR